MLPPQPLRNDMKAKELIKALEGTTPDREVVFLLEYDQADMPEYDSQYKELRCAPREIKIDYKNARQFDGKGTDLARLIIKVSDY